MAMEPGKLFVGGISWDTNEGRLKEYFQTFGEVVEAVIMKDRATGRARGFGFVVFEDPSVAERVVKEKHMIDGRTVEAKKAVPRDDQHMNRNSVNIPSFPGSIRTRKIFVGGLASSVSESDFKKYFDQFGTITDVVVMYDHNTQRPRGFGFITYDSEEAVDRVLHKMFHELNGKMVEVKRAVPKELSPGPNRSPLGGYNSGLNRVNSFPNGYTLSSLGGYGVRMDRFSPTVVGRSGYSLFNQSRPTLNSPLNLNFSETGNLSSNIGYGGALNSFNGGLPNRYNAPIGNAPGGVGSGSMLKSTSWNLWDSENLSYSTNPANFVGSGSGNSGLAAPFGGLGTIWGSSISSQTGRNGCFDSENFTYNNGGNSFGSGGGYAQNSGSYAATENVYIRDSGNLYGTGNRSFFEDPTPRSSSPKLEVSGSFGYGLESISSDVMPNNSRGCVGGYTVTNRSNRGKVKTRD
ncbi:PREDICTED: heterogeneous nuclear ribonucleoprotein 1-like isoform X2 [Ipomoea nil]|uniref:heterogeneous nuclear ribonucleoprotein 1-like isoform X2 n=1 Tax=Ipomoea nil TaxID=35883 RepID=UPI000901F223|nr:PREDICTED: heterogeneous nuclear ribonucleoprotein 1-like isoform X2 [Ipomoea nil]